MVLGGGEVQAHAELVEAAGKGVVVVSEGHVAEVGERCGGHPVLELGPVADVREVGLVVAVGVELGPVGRRHDAAEVVGRLLEAVLVGRPGDAVGGHGVVACVGVVDREERRVERVVEHGVGYQAARVDDLPRVVDRQRLAVLAHGVLDHAHARVLPVQLVLGKGLHVLPVVGVEPGQLVEEEQRALEVVGDLKLQLADVPLLVKAVPHKRVVSRQLPLRGRAHLALEVVRVQLQRDVRPRVRVRPRGALRVVDCEVLHVVRRVEHRRPDRDEDDRKTHKHGDDRTRRQDRVDRLQPLLREVVLLWPSRLPLRLLFQLRVCLVVILHQVLTVVDLHAHLVLVPRVLRVSLMALLQPKDVVHVVL